MGSSAKSRWSLSCQDRISESRGTPLPDPSKETEMDVEYSATVKTIKKVLSERLDGKAKLPGEKTGAFGEPTLR